MQIDTKRYLAEMDLRPILAAAVRAPAVPAVAQCAPLPSRLPAGPVQPPCEHQVARSAARTDFLERKIAPKHDRAVAMPETRDRTVVTVHAAMLRAAPTAVPHPKEALAAEQQGSSAEAFLSPLAPSLSVFRALGPPGMGPPGLGLGPPGFAVRQPPSGR
jgi:hypothetical protein